jgi:hypothetical protein
MATVREFSSFGAFALFLGGLVVKEVEAEKRGLERAAKLLKKAAKDKIGEYQGQAGPFVAWAELAESTKRDREKHGFTENDPGLRTGEMRDSIEHEVDGREAQIGSNDDKLVWFELGTSKQPPRSVLGGTAFERADEVVRTIGDVVFLALAGQGVHEGRMEIPAGALE